MDGSRNERETDWRDRDEEAQPARGDSGPYLSTISHLRQVLARNANGV